jgi:uncharacterized phage-associated protein
MSHSVLAVANKFLDLAEREHVTLTPMHLQKLCYLAHGFGLAFINEDLIRDPVEAWPYGPVFPILYDALKAYGSGKVSDPIRERNWAVTAAARGEIVCETFTKQETDVMQRVFDTYASFPAFQLSALTHEDGSPWHQMYSEGRRNARIPNHLMRDYFLGLAPA